MNSNQRQALYQVLYKAVAQDDWIKNREVALRCLKAVEPLIDAMVNEAASHVTLQQAVEELLNPIAAQQVPESGEECCQTCSEGSNEDDDSEEDEDFHSQGWKRLNLSEKDVQAFFEALLSPPEPNQALTEAMSRRRTLGKIFVVGLKSPISSEPVQAASYKDAYGNEVKVGDPVAFALPYTSMMYGIVKEFEGDVVTVMAHGKWYSLNRNQTVKFNADPQAFMGRSWQG